MPLSETQPDEKGSQPSGSDDVSKARPALARLKRELSDDELGSAGVQKLLLDRLETAEAECAALKKVESKWHEADKNLAVSNERLKMKTASEVLSTGTLAAGAALLGYVPSIWAASSATGPMLLCIGVVLTVVGIASKVIQR